jgi:3'5'-cyclic nucleotide phosphodiesterase
LLLIKDNEFHNFEHATHVLMSVLKLLGRVTNASEAKDHGGGNGEQEQAPESSFHFDPLIQFGCVLAALVHDADHQGVSNLQLVKEGTTLAARYHNQAVAEQNSIDIAWAVFMSEEYAQFRKVLCPSERDLRRLRQIVVNCVIATDVMDKDLKEDRNARWDKAFDLSTSTSDFQQIKNRRANLVLEHLIQASDVSHCMQHWHVYRKWNERLFQEMYAAYLVRRGDRNPAETWYKGELGFFDFYIIPLAKKLRDCEVFGVSSDEFLNYAEQNRAEWERRGEEIVAQMVNKVSRLTC